MDPDVFNRCKFALVAAFTLNISQLNLDKSFVLKGTPISNFPG